MQNEIESNNPEAQNRLLDVLVFLNNIKDPKARRVHASALIVSISKFMGNTQKEQEEFLWNTWKGFVLITQKESKELKE